MACDTWGMHNRVIWPGRGSAPTGMERDDLARMREPRAGAELEWRETIDLVDVGLMMALVAAIAVVVALVLR